MEILTLGSLVVVTFSFGGFAVQLSIGQIVCLDKSPLVYTRPLISAVTVALFYPQQHVNVPPATTAEYYVEG